MNPIAARRKCQTFIEFSDSVNFVILIDVVLPEYEILI